MEEDTEPAEINEAGDVGRSLGAEDVADTTGYTLARGPKQLLGMVQPHGSVQKRTTTYPDKLVKSSRPSVQMKLAVFYHATIGEYPDINRNYARTLFMEQMDLLVASGLYDNANEIHVGLNGDDTAFVMNHVPPGARVIPHGRFAKSLVPTFLLIEDWAKSHSDWWLCIWHMKGVTHPHDDLNVLWRKCMERVVIWNWKRCVSDLELGYDSVGAHWLTREKYGPQVNTFFWGGAFYWVTASFLTCLPKMISEVKTRDDWFYPENWIGMGPRPVVMDYAPHWPGLVPCQKMI